jgi:hypothetical protein
MDPQLLQLFAAAMGRDGGLSTMLGNLDNQLLAVLAGVYTPPVETGGGTLYNQYKATEAQNPDIINRILYNIENGMNEYEIEADIDAAIAELGQNFDVANVNAYGQSVTPLGMAPDTLKSMAKAMQKEYSSDKGKADYWQKAGLRNPIDVYTIEDVPMSAQSQMSIQDIQSALPGIMQRRKGATSSLGGLMRSFSERQKQLGDYREEVSRSERFATTPQDDGVEMWDELGNIDDARRKELEMWSGGRIPQKGSTPQISRYVKEPAKPSSKKQKMDQTNLKAIIATLAKTNQEKEDATMREMAVRQGTLDAYKMAGRTPLMDQLTAMTRFISGMPKK